MYKWSEASVDSRHPCGGGGGGGGGDCDRSAPVKSCDLWHRPQVRGHAAPRGKFRPLGEIRRWRNKWPHLPARWPGGFIIQVDESLPDLQPLVVSPSSVLPLSTFFLPLFSRRCRCCLWEPHSHSLCPLSPCSPALLSSRLSPAEPPFSPQSAELNLNDTLNREKFFVQFNLIGFTTPHPPSTTTTAAAQRDADMAGEFAVECPRQTRGRENSLVEYFEREKKKYPIPLYVFSKGATYIYLSLHLQILPCLCQTVS